MTQPLEPQKGQANEFEHLRDGEQISLVREFFQFIAENKKWWLTPIVLVLLLMGMIVVLGGTGAAPFIYTLF
jgi:hypothetical protein